MSAGSDVQQSRPRDGGRISYSSSPGLSSPPSPHTPPHEMSHPRLLTYPQSLLPSSLGHVDGKVEGERPTKVILAKNTAPRKPRQKKEQPGKTENASKSNTTTDSKDPAPKVRKPRAPSGASSSTAGRKKKSVATNETQPQPATSPHGWRLSENTHKSQTYEYAPTPAQPPQNGNDEAIAKTLPAYTYLPTIVPRSSSGQNYDPIRSATIEPRSIAPQKSYNTTIRSSTPPRPINYTSNNASPSIAIASLIDKPANQPQSYNFPKPLKRIHEVQSPSSPTKRSRTSPPVDNHIDKAVRSHDSRDSRDSQESLPMNHHALNGHTTTPTEIDVDHLPQPIIKTTAVAKQSVNASTGASSRAHSPKPTRQKETAVALPLGNGLLSNAMFGGVDDIYVPGKTAPTVILHVSLKDCSHKYVNFARMAEERYGFNALHPRLAASRERLARVAAAGAAIELASKGARNSGSGLSADDMSVDLSDHEGGGDDSNIEMGGMSVQDVMRSGGEGSEATLVKKVTKKRTTKEDRYDKDDPFVDDTELAWEEQAAASKDGFFVYSGPLVPEGEQANIERYLDLQPNPSLNTNRLTVVFREGDSKRARGGKNRSAAARAPKATTAAITKPAPAARKPRVTKAARVQMEQDKTQRANMANLAAKPTGYPNL